MSKVQGVANKTDMESITVEVEALTLAVVKLTNEGQFAQEGIDVLEVRSDNMSILLTKLQEKLTEAQEKNRENFQKAWQDCDKKDKEITELQTRIETIIVKIDELHKRETSQVEEPIWFKVSEPVESFTGRTKELEDLYEFVKRSVDTKQITVISQITSISGLGGIGKSELSRKYAQQHREDFPDNNVIWINAENLDISFRDLAQELKISTKDVDGRNKDIKSIIREVYKVSSKRKSLFIFDNADKYKTTQEGQGIDEFLPQLPPDANKPYIIITSRNQQWGDKIKVLSLGLFSKEEAIEFIKKSLNIDNDVQNLDIAELAETLQYFPLALQQAVGYIRQADEELKNIEPEKTYKINDYLKEYETKTKELLNYEFPDDSYDLYSKTTFTTWKITFDKIKQTKHGEKALEILNIMAYLAPEDIPNKMFLELTDEVNLRAIIHLLKQYSMIGIKAGTSNIHRLVQQVIRLDLKEQGKEEEIFTKTFTILKEYFPYGSDTLEDCAKKRQLLLHLEKFLLHIDNQLKEQPTKQEIETDYLEYLLIWISDGYSTLGDPQKQKESLERALLIQEKHYDPDHFQVAITLRNLGNAYGTLGDPQKQKELLERALLIQEKYYGSEHFQVARTLVSLGDAYEVLGYPQKELLERALLIQEKHYGSDHFEVAITLLNLGNAYGDLGDPQKKKELLGRALVIQEKHYGPDHFKVARTLGELGNAYRRLGDPKKQKELLERALLIKEKYYGPEHFQVASTLVNLSNAYNDLGNHHKKKELLERALLIKEKYYGPEHFNIASTLLNLSNVYGDLGYPKKQKELLERALLIKEKHYGPDHFKVANTLENLGNAYGALGDPQKQKELLERALFIQEKYYGPDHFKVASPLGKLGNAYGNLGDPQKQKELLERALLIQEKHYGSEHFQVARTLGKLGKAYENSGDPQKQKELLERALVIQEKHYGPDHFEVAITLRNLGNTYGALGNPQKQKELVERALVIQEKHYGPEHFKVADTLGSLGNAYGKLDDHQKQKELLERALVIQEKHYGREHFEVAVTIGSLGNAYGTLGDPRKQKELLERALTLQEKHYGSDHFCVAHTRENLGNAYGALGDYEKQKELQKNVLLIQEKHYGSEHFKVASTLTSLGNTYGILGNPQKQKELLERALMIQEKHYGFEHVNVTLLSAAEQGQLEVVKWLIEEKGANVNVTDNNDKTSLDLATEKGYTKISVYLKSKELEGKGNIDESLVSMQDNITTITGISNVIESEIKLAGEGNLIAP